jgi:hypothetical protein
MHADTVVNTPDQQLLNEFFDVFSKSSGPSATCLPESIVVQKLENILSEISKEENIETDRIEVLANGILVAMRNQEAHFGLLSDHFASLVAGQLLENEGNEESTVFSVLEKLSSLM